VVTTDGEEMQMALSGAALQFIGHRTNQEPALEKRQGRATRPARCCRRCRSRSASTFTFALLPVLSKQQDHPLYKISAPVFYVR
jgi:hypothetical protein